MKDLRKQYFEQLLKYPSDTETLRKIKLEILQSETGNKYLYKYCSIYTALKILQSKYIKLQAPDNFNDPFDCLSNVAVWNHNVRFAPREEEMIYVKELLNSLPEKFQLPYMIYNDLRTSYFYAITCFTTGCKNSLMWAHYAQSHGAVCLEFKISDVLEYIHPCFYTEEIPTLNWQSDNINLALVKSDAWSYENEWRYIRKTIRPKMRVYGQISHQIYNNVQSLKFTQKDAEEWGQKNGAIIKTLESTYEEECQLFVQPSKIFLGLNFGTNFTNENTSAIINEIDAIAKNTEIPIHRIHAKADSFKLQDSIIHDLSLFNTPYLS